MSDLPAVASVPIVATPNPSRNAVPSKGRLVLAAFLSALLPGAGHFLVRRWQKGLAFLLAFGLILLLYWWLRLPRTFVGAAAPALAVIAISVLATWDVAYAGKTGDAKPSQWWLALLLPAALAAGRVHLSWQLHAAGFAAYILPSRSMAPTLPINTGLMVDRWRYLHTAPLRGDIIVFLSPSDNRVLITKRVIAVGGETIEVRGDTVLVDGKTISEPYATFAGPLPDVAARIAPTTLPPGTFFVMGDSRHDSLDSRMYGPINSKSIRGKVIYTIPSFTRDGRTFE